MAKNVGVIGLGYVGLPLLREFLDKDFRAIGFDIDPVKVDSLNRGKSYIRHIPEKLIMRWVESDRFLATTDFSKLKDVDAILICVPTPLDQHEQPDLSFVVGTCETIAQYLRKDHLVVLESTTYPGTTDEVMKPILERSGLKAGEDFCLAFSPEREDPGNPSFSTAKIPKVVGGYSPRCLQRAIELYEEIVEVVPVSSTAVAEATKILENTYRAVNIALVNELKMLFDRMGIDVWEVIRAAATKPFGFQAFYPGPGLGGHCIPIDPFYLTWKAKEYDFHTRFIELAGDINTRQPYYVLDRLIRAMNRNHLSIVGAKVLVVGLSYKPNVDDIRESPALKIMELLLKEQAKVDYHDPYFPSVPPTRKGIFKMKSVNLAGLEGDYYDAAVIVTDHANIDYAQLLEKAKVVVDTRNVIKRLGLRTEKLWTA
ncbi:MAG TPA: nucleotide sugar dehydrogenase [Syntrophales bacterium]|nr:nucleotide sugar dehydrogenase [Syntrophales bacterium]